MPNLTRIPLSAPDISDIEREAVAAVLSTSTLSGGPWKERLERAMAEWLGAPHAIAVSSGSAALQLCLHVSDIREGDEVITTPFTVPAVLNSILHAGATPVFADIDPESLNLDPTRVAEAITSRTRVILAVHTLGRPAPLKALTEIADAHGAIIIEDACQAFGASRGNRKLGTLAELGLYAFYPNKQMTMAEGGLLVCKDDEIAARLHRLCNHGRDPRRDWLDQTELGFNFRLSELHSALGMAQLQRIDELLTRRARVAAIYDRLLSVQKEIRRPPMTWPEHDLSWFAYVVQLNGGITRAQRDALIEYMAGEGIACGRYFAPLHLQPFYRERFGGQVGDFPVTEAVADRALALPFYNGMGEGDQRRVCDTLRVGLGVV